MRLSFHPTFGIPGLFVTGTDTGVGKTEVTSAIASALTACDVVTSVYKPVCSGVIDETSDPLKWDDIERLRDAIGERQSVNEVCPQRFLAPLAPPVAARIEGRSVNDDLLADGLAIACRESQAVLIEGAGGLFCPITEQKSIADVAIDFRFPILIVGRLGLGTINHTLLTVEAAERRGLDIAGIVLSQTSPDDGDPSTSTNPIEIANRTDVPVLGILPYGERELLPVSSAETKIDWAEWFWDLFEHQTANQKNYE